MKLKTKLAVGCAGLLTLGGGSAWALVISPAGAAPAAPAVATQTAPAPEAPDTESAAPESSAPGAAADTHADAAGQDVNHECPPSCDTANGETP